MILFDSDWNPQNDVQAQARCHRIGQDKPVMVYRLITSRTYEQEMFTRAGRKLGTSAAVLKRSEVCKLQHPRLMEFTNVLMSIFCKRRTC